jgi:hypothetical protein
VGGAGDGNFDETAILVNDFRLTIFGCRFSIADFFWRDTLESPANRKLTTGNLQSLLGRRLMVGQVPLEHFV